MKRNLWTILSLLVLMSLLAACQQAAAPAAEEQPAAEEEPAAAEEAAGEEVPPIKVGALLPLTGTDAINGQNQQLAHDWAVEQINEAGGIECLNGANLEMVYADSQGKPEAGNAETERLITQEDVITVMGAFHSGVTLPATEIAERYEVPFMVPNALAGAITERGLEYVFKTAVSIEQMAEDTAQFSADMGAQTAAILVPNITFGEEFAKAWEETIPGAGLELIDDLAYPAGASDFSDAILALRAADPDVVLTIGNTADATLLVRQMQELDYWPTQGVVTAAGGFADPTLVGNLAEAANGLYLTNDWFPNINLPGAQELNQEFKDQFGLDMTGNINTTYAAMWVLKEALEQSCSRDPQELAEVLRTTEFEGGNYGFMYPAVEFDESGFNEFTSNVIAQIQEGEPLVVWPEEFAVAEPIWPVPGWDNRAEMGSAPLEVMTEEAAAPEEGVLDIINSEEVNEAALSSDYSQDILEDAETVVDTSQYQKEGPYVIAVSQQDPSNGWGNTYNVTIAAYGEQLLEEGVLAEPLLFSATNDANQQISDIETFTAQQPDAIVVEPLGRAASTTVIKRAVDAGIPVVLCANGIEGEDFTSRVDIDFYEVAYKSGVGLAELMGGEGTIVMFNGIAGVDSTETWREAALDALANYPEISIIAEEYAQWNIATAKQKMEAVMAANPEIDGVWAGGGEMALGAALAFEDAGVEAPKFAMVNVPNGFLRLAQEHDYEFVGAPDPPSMASFCLQTAVDILEGDEGITKFISLKTLMDGAEPYDHTNFEQWYVPDLNDDFIPPPTVDLQHYIEGGFERK